MKSNNAPRLVSTGITVVRGSRRIVDNADLTLNAGELTILAGPNGAGKTTLARAMAGVMRAEGSTAFDGVSLRHMQPRARARAISYLPQGHEFHWPMRVDSIVALGREPHADPFSQTSSQDRIAIRARHRGNRRRRIFIAADHHAVGRRTGARRHRKGAGHRSVGADRRRTHDLARRTPPAHRDGSASAHRPRRHRRPLRSFTISLWRCDSRIAWSS